MRSLRWVLLVALVLIAAAVLRIYTAQRKIRRSERRPVPAAVPLDTKTIAPDWEFTQSADGKPAFRIKAKNMKQSADNSREELEQIELQIYTKDGEHYDRVKSAYAQLTTTDHKLYSPGDAEITLDVPVHGEPTRQLTSITAAGINFDSQSGQAITEKHVNFAFAQGTGTCDGATYDPNNHILTLMNNVVVNLKGKGPNAMPMRVETAQLTWNEISGLIHLAPWAKFKRDQTNIEAGDSLVQLVDNEVQWIDGKMVHGTDQRTGRQIAYGAESVRVNYNDNHQIALINGVGHARLIEHGVGSETTIDGDRVDLGFVDNKGESVLNLAVVNGNGNLESKPLPDPKGDTADTKILKADGFTLQMKPGGKELQQVTTRSPGTLEFLPNQPTHHRRLLKAAQMSVIYGANNEVQAFHAAGVGEQLASTETYPSEDDRRRRKSTANALTTSKTIDASFDEKGQLKHMKQADHFHYAEADRKAQADVAQLENATNIMDLDKNARITDSTGSTSADHIQINQNTGDFDARGHVSTTHLPDDKKNASAMLDKDEPTLGTADRVTSANRNRLVHYAGNAVVWQTSNRIQGDRIDIDRDKKSIVADGRVVTQFEDKPNPGAPPSAKPAQPIFTIVKSPHMVYTDADRQASYTGGVDFWRPSLTVKSATLKAYLNPDNSDSDSRINHALSDGNVEIVQFAADRQRVGKGEHAEYYTGEGKVVLTGGQPKLDDTKRGNTTGERLTWYTDDDRLVVEGGPEKKGQSHIRRKTS